MSVALNRALVTTGRDLARGVATRQLAATTAHATATGSPEQWRSTAALREADRILRQVRENVAPELEPVDPDVNDGDPSRDTEPLDPTIDSAKARQAEDDEEERQTDDEDDDETRGLQQGKDVDITVIDVDEETELADEDELAYP
jgi:hypothetical protein